MLTLLIDAQERRDVATTDVVGAYLMADMNDFVLVKLTGESVGIMCTVNPMLEDYRVVDGERKTYIICKTS